MKKHTPLIEYSFRFLLILLSIAVSLLLVEGFLRLTVDPRPSGSGKGILSRLYFENLKQVVDESGFRNTPEKQNFNKLDYVFIGDSFTYGHGVNDGENYQSVFERLLLEQDEGANVINLALSGNNTVQELDILREYAEGDRKRSIENGYVVFQYFGNDIEYLGEPLEAEPLNAIEQVLSDWMEYSYFVDLVYQSRYLTSISSGNYIEFLEGKYDDADIFQTHAKDVEAVYRYVHSMDANIVFMAFPLLGNADMPGISEDLYIDKLKTLFGESCADGDKYFDLVKFLEDAPLKPEEWVVNSADAHPSVRLHHLIGQELYRSVVAQSQYVYDCGR